MVQGTTSEQGPCGADPCAGASQATVKMRGAFAVPP